MSEPARRDVVPSQLDHRPDVQWLRAVAVLAVVAYHLNVPGSSGGFVGVDVFLVVSGYLISRLLLHELATTGRIRLQRFFHRRLRRLLPVSLLGIVATLAAMSLLWSPLRRAGEQVVASAATFFGANVVLALRQTDYLGIDRPSALQHYWSLGLEEQFYLLWPVLLLAAWAIGRCAGRPSRELLLLLAATTVASAVVAMHWTQTVQPFAFFLLPARVWEFSVGALLAAVELRGARPRRRRLLWAVGGAALAVSFVSTSTAGFPWPGAVLPVAGTLAMLWAGVRADELPAVLRAPSMQWIGDRSYAWYVWHWPPIVLLGLTDATGTDRWPARVAVLLGTVVAAHVTHRWVEQPLRYGPFLQWRPRALATAASGMVAVVAVAGLVTTLPVADPSEFRATADLDRAVAVGAVGDGPALTFEMLRRPQLPTSDVVPDDLTPPPREVVEPRPRERREQPMQDQCHAPIAQPDVPPRSACTYGDLDGAQTWVLVGDSHALMWHPAAVEAATAAGARLVSLTKGACSVYEEDPVRPGVGSYPGCLDWREQARDRMAELQPDVVLVGGAADHEQRRQDSDYLQTMRAGLRLLAERVPDARVVVLGEPPRPTDDVALCVEEAARLAACAVAPSPDFDAAVARLTTELGMALVTPADLLCRDGTCPAVLGNVLIYRDDNHLTTVITEIMTPAVLDAVGPVGDAEP